ATSAVPPLLAHRLADGPLMPAAAGSSAPDRSVASARGFFRRLRDDFHPASYVRAHTVPGSLCVVRRPTRPVLVVATGQVCHPECPHCHRRGKLKVRWATRILAPPHPADMTCVIPPIVERHPN